MEDFVNRESQFPNRRRLEIVSQTPNEIIADIYREEGAISNNGTPITAQTLNAMKNEFANRGTTINVNGEAQSSINFTSDPQSQINLKVNRDDINFNAVQFAEKGYKKVENNLFDLTYNGTLLAGTQDLPISNHIVAKVTCNQSNGGIVVKTRLTENGYIYEFSDVNNASYYASLYLKFLNLKPLTKYRLNFNQSQNKAEGRFLDISGYGYDQYTYFTTDETGSYGYTSKISPQDVSGNDPLIVSRIQLIEFDEYTEYQKHYGETLHNGANDTVVEYWSSRDGSTWYRKWASGWKECGGRYTHSVTGSISAPIIFSIPFTQPPIVVASLRRNTTTIDSNYHGWVECNSISKDGFNYYAWWTSGSDFCDYYACGY